MGSSTPDIAAIVCFWPDLPILNTKISRRCQILSGVVQGIDTSFSIFSNVFNLLLISYRVHMHKDIKFLINARREIRFKLGYIRNMAEVQVTLDI